MSSASRIIGSTNQAPNADTDSHNSAAEWMDTSSSEETTSSEHKATQESEAAAERDTTPPSIDQLSLDPFVTYFY